LGHIGNAGAAIQEGSAGRSYNDFMKFTGSSTAAVRSLVVAHS